MSVVYLPAVRKSLERAVERVPRPGVVERVHRVGEYVSGLLESAREIHGSAHDVERVDYLITEMRHPRREMAELAIWERYRHAGPDDQIPYTD